MPPSNQPKLSDEDIADLKATAKMMEDVKIASDHLSQVAADMRKEGLLGLPLFVSLLGVVAQEGARMVNLVPEDKPNHRIFLASQLAGRVLTTGEAIMKLVEGLTPTEDIQGNG